MRIRTSCIPDDVDVKETTSRDALLPKLLLWILRDVWHEPGAVQRGDLRVLCQFLGQDQGDDPLGGRSS